MKKQFNYKHGYILYVLALYSGMTTKKDNKWMSPKQILDIMKLKNNNTSLTIEDVIFCFSYLPGGQGEGLPDGKIELSEMVKIRISPKLTNSFRKRIEQVMEIKQK